MIEPLAAADLTVVETDALTGLAEYRNGGLFVDMGILVPRHSAILSEAHEVDSEIIVEWRALTVTLIDRVADAVRAALNLTTTELTLAQILEGGTWRAGREVAAERRPNGGPPIRLVSDGTVF